MEANALAVKKQETKKLGHFQITLLEGNLKTHAEKLLTSVEKGKNTLVVINLGSTTDVSHQEAAKLVEGGRLNFGLHFTIINKASSFIDDGSVKLVFGMQYDRNSHPNVPLYAKAGVGCFMYRSFGTGSKLHHSDGFHFRGMLQSDIIIDMHAEGSDQTPNESLFGCYKEMINKMTELNHETLAGVIMRSKHHQNLNFHFRKV